MSDDGRDGALWQARCMSEISTDLGRRMWWVDAFIGEGARGSPAVVVLLEGAPDVPRDLAAAKALFEKAAAMNHPGALYNLGVLAIEGEAH